MKFQVWYMRGEYFRHGILGYKYLVENKLLPSPKYLNRTHVHLMDMEAENLEQLFVKCQGENWSPQGEARPLIKQKGLRHTSMSVGDVAIDPNGFVYITDNVGFERLGRVE